MTIYPDSNLQLDDVVATSREVTGRGQVLTSGIVTDVCGRGTRAPRSAGTSSSSRKCPAPCGCRRSPK